MDDEKRKVIGDDGELNYDADFEDESFGRKRKLKDAPSVRVPITLVAPLVLLLLVVSVLLLVSRWNTPTVISPTAAALNAFASADALIDSSAYNQSRDSAGGIAYGTQMNVQYYTVTPANYPKTRCDASLTKSVPSGTIMFVAGSSDNMELFAIDGAGHNLCRVTQNLIDEQAPRWSMDRSSIAFSSTRTDKHGTDIYVGTTFLTDLLNVTDRIEQESFSPAWSPDGKQLVFTGRSEVSIDGSDVYVINRDGTGRKNLTTSPANNQAPVWSPDGQRIAFLSDRDYQPSEYKLYLMNADGSSVHEVPSTPGMLYSVQWSPDGQNLVFDTNTGISITNLRTLTTKPVISGGYNPIWSPDGSEIAFTSHNNLYVTPVDHFALHRLTDTIYITAMVDWR